MIHLIVLRLNTGRRAQTNRMLFTICRGALNRGRLLWVYSQTPITLLKRWCITVQEKDLKVNSLLVRMI